MFKLKYNGQEIGLDKDCRIEWNSVETNASDSPTGWCATHEGMCKDYRRIKKLIYMEKELRILLTPEQREQVIEYSHRGWNMPEDYDKGFIIDKVGIFLTDGNLNIRLCGSEESYNAKG